MANPKEVTKPPKKGEEQEPEVPITEPTPTGEDNNGEETVPEEEPEE